MAADDRVEPVGDEDGAVGADGHVARPEPLAPIAIDLVPDVVRVGRGQAREEVEALEGEAGAARLHAKAEDHVAPGIGAQEHAPVPTSERVAFVADDARRCAGAGVVARRLHARVVLVPVGRERVLTGTAIRLPEARAVVAEIAGVRAFHQPRHAAGHHLVVVVVLPEISERVDGQFIRIPEVVRDDLQPRGIRIDSQRQSSSPDAVVVADHSSLVLLVVRRPACIETPGAQRPSGTIGDDVGTGVAGVEVVAAVGAGDERVQPMVVIEPAEPGQEHLLLVRHVVFVLVGVGDEMWRRGHDDAAADDRQPERRAQVLVLHEDLGAVRASVVVGVRKDDDAIAGRMIQGALLGGVERAVVHRLGDPDAPARIDVDVRRVEEHRGLCPEGDLEIVRQHELIAQRLGVGARSVRDQRDRQNRGGTPGSSHGCGV